MQALGRFTVKWSQKGIIQYACWFSYSPHYFKCVNGIRGIKIESENDYGVLVYDDYLYFPMTESSNPVIIDPATLSTFLTLSTKYLLLVIQLLFFPSRYFAIVNPSTSHKLESALP